MIFISEGCLPVSCTLTWCEILCASVAPRDLLGLSSWQVQPSRTGWDGRCGVYACDSLPPHSGGASVLSVHLSMALFHETKTLPHSSLQMPQHPYPLRKQKNSFSVNWVPLWKMCQQGIASWFSMTSTLAWAVTLLPGTWHIISQQLHKFSTTNALCLPNSC